MDTDSRKRLLQMLLFAPAVWSCLALFGLFSILGIVFFGWGLLGLAGLGGLVAAWFRFAWPSPVTHTARLHRICLLLGIVGASILVAFAIPRGVRGEHDDLVVLAAALSVIELGIWFLMMLSPRARRERRDVDTDAMVAGIVVALGTAILPVATFAGMAGETTHDLRREQIAEARQLADRAAAAVAAYVSRHEGRYPDDNASAGLPAPASLRGRFVSSVAVDHGMVVARFGSDWVANLYDVSAAGAHLSLVPQDGRQRAGRMAWACRISGYRSAALASSSGC